MAVFLKKTLLSSQDWRVQLLTDELEEEQGTHTNNTHYHTYYTPYCTVRPHIHTHARLLTCRLSCMLKTHSVSRTHTRSHTISLYVAFSFFFVVNAFHSSMPDLTMQDPSLFLMANVNELPF